uniref:Uncharacterized protein n=1 Tax=Jaculus jaculus TaxID=51337 RepID=A0A8C5KGX5_JACJA
MPLKFLCKELWVAVFQKQMDGLFLAFACGPLCGAPRTLGFQSLVIASVAALPSCKFQVLILKPR